MTVKFSLSYKKTPHFPLRGKVSQLRKNKRVLRWSIYIISLLGPESNPALSVTGLLSPSILYSRAADEQLFLTKRYCSGLLLLLLLLCLLLGGGRGTTDVPPTPETGDPAPDVPTGQKQGGVGEGGGGGEGCTNLSIKGNDGPVSKGAKTGSSLAEVHFLYPPHRLGQG